MPLPNVVSLSVKKAAELSTTSIQKIYAAIRNGHLKAYQPTAWSKTDAPGDMIVMVDDLERWLKSNPVEPDRVPAVQSDVSAA